MTTTAGPADTAGPAITARRPAATDDQLDRPRAALLREDAAVTALVGLVALLAPLSLWGDPPRWVPLTVGVVSLVAAVDVALVSRWTGRRLRVATAVTGVLALATGAAGLALLVLGDLTAAGAVLVGAATVACVAFGTLEVRASRRR